MENSKPEDGDLEYGRKLFAQACDFVISAAHLDQVPETALPEVSFWGRSNVGKSSLVNALTGRKTLARTSNTPCRTQQINFFNLDGRLMLSDLPGYGYARAPRTEVRKWTGMTTAYLKGRVPLRRVCLLVDGRHGIKKTDQGMMDELDEAAVSYQVILTKCDKVADGPLKTLVAETQAELSRRPAAHPEIMVTSAKDGRGIAELRAVLAALAMEREVG